MRMNTFDTSSEDFQKHIKIRKITGFGGIQQFVFVITLNFWTQPVLCSDSWQTVISRGYCPTGPTEHAQNGRMT